MNEPIRILTVEDLKTDFELAQREIHKSVPHCVFQQVETREGFLQALETFQPDLILSDYSLPRFDGMTALKLAQERAPWTPFIIWTGSQSEDVAVECMRAGANNYILKENLKRLGPAVLHALKEGRLLLQRQQADIELRQQSDDLSLVNAINAAVIRGESLDEIVKLLVRELKRIFACEGSTVYMLDPEGTWLAVRQYYLPPEVTRQIEKLIGSTIPLIQIPIRAGGYFHRVLSTGRGMITSDPEEIHSWIAEFTETNFLTAIARNAVRALIPQIYKILNIKSIIAVPLMLDGRAIGILDVSGPGLFTEDDLRRVENISGQLTAAIQRQQFDEKVRRSEEFLQSIQNALSASIAILDEAGIIVQVNSAWRKFAEQNGLAHPNYGIGLNYLEICDSATGWDAEEAPVAAKAIREVIAGQRREAWIEYPCHSPEEKHWFTLRITRFEDGDRVWVVLAHENITERKQAENALRESEVRFAGVINSAMDAVISVNSDQHIVLFNPAAEQMFGCKAGEALGQPVERFIPHQYRAQHREYILRFGQTGDTSRAMGHLGALSGLRTDGTEFPIEASISHIEAGEQHLYTIILRDITERIQAEQDLRRGEERYRGLFENLVIGFALHEVITNEAGEPVDYIFLEINPMFEKLTGIRAREALGRRVTEVLPGVEHDRFIQAYGRVALTGEPMHLEEFSSALGKYYEINAYSPTRGQFAVTFTDITERRQAELQLRKLSRAVQQSASTIVITDAAGNIEYVNPKFTQITGYTFEEVAGRNPRLLKSGYTPPEEYRRLWASISAGEEWRGELYNRKKNGDFFWEQATISPIMNERSETTHYIAVKEDVTERKRTETLMEKRFELMEYAAGHSLQELVQKALDEISAWTHSTIGFFQFIEADQVTPSLQIWSTDTFRQFHNSEAEAMHLPADQAGVWAEAMRQRRAVIHNDYVALPRKKGLPEGHAPVIRELILPIIRNEKIVAVIGIGNKPQEYTRNDLEITERFADYAWDITERKQMELALAEERNQLARRVDERTTELIRANSNLARALRVKDEFLANMSHELRTPLNAILGLSESLAEQIAGPLNEKQLKYITTISESGHHLLSLINDILDLAKIEAGQITLDINKVDVNSVCQASLRMIKQLAQKKNQEVSLEIEAGVGLMWADERRLKQMMVNLLSNAVKFTPEGGRLGLEIHGDQEANKVMITVWDNGIGIYEKDLDRLFKPFVQLDSGLARESSGTGLGLVLVAQMARLHGGSVQVTSAPGQGSRFTIELPWEPALALDAAERMKITGKFYGIRPGAIQPTLLLIEDTPDVVMMLKDYLEMQGYNVVTAQDGLDGVAQAKLTHPDLILMDVQMPRMDGLEATQKLRQDPEFKYTPIIALTALAMPSDRERCLAAGMDEYISKPVNLRALSKIIQGCLSAREEKTRPR